MDRAKRLKELQRLLDEGLITKEQHDVFRNEILGSLVREETPQITSPESEEDSFLPDSPRNKRIRMWRFPLVVGCFAAILSVLTYLGDKNLQTLADPVSYMVLSDDSIPRGLAIISVICLFLSIRAIVLLNNMTDAEFDRNKNGKILL